MFLGNEINNLFSKLFASASSNQTRYCQTGPQADYRLPLMQIVEKKVSQKSLAGGTGLEKKSFSMDSRMALASEVGPPPLTPAAWRK